MLPVAVASVTGLRFSEGNAADGDWYALRHSGDANTESSQSPPHHARSESGAGGRAYGSLAGFRLWKPDPGFQAAKVMSHGDHVTINIQLENRVR